MLRSVARGGGSVPYDVRRKFLIWQLVDMTDYKRMA